MDLLSLVESELYNESRQIDFKSGDTINVHYKIKEGNKERIQQYQGIVMQIAGKGPTKTFTVRKISANNVGVERIFPINSPYIDKIEIVRRGDVRRARLFYLRDLSGKKVKIKEKRVFSDKSDKNKNEDKVNKE